jgi:hypothetical protein
VGVKVVHASWHNLQTTIRVVRQSTKSHESHTS